MPTEGPSDFDRNAIYRSSDSRIGLKGATSVIKVFVAADLGLVDLERCLPGRNGMNWSRRRWSDGSSCLNI